jgi:hypothetical protein
MEFVPEEVAAFHCSIGDKITLVQQQNHTDPVTVKIRSATMVTPSMNFEALTRKLDAAFNVQEWVICGTLENYLENYKHNHASRLF